MAKEENEQQVEQVEQKPTAPKAIDYCANAETAAAADSARLNTQHRAQFTGEGVHVFIMRPNGASTPAGPAASVGGAHELANALGLRSEDVWVTWGYEPAHISLAANCPPEGQLSLALAQVR